MPHTESASARPATDQRPPRLITPALVAHLRAHFRLDWQGLHGVRHWARVRAHGLALARHTGARREVVELFAFLHDSGRCAESNDPWHGEVAAQRAQALQGRFYTLGAEALALLTEACRDHTRKRHHPDPTIATCWDADRLDLWRVGIRPDPARMCTRAGRERCRAMEFELNANGKAGKFLVSG